MANTFKVIARDVAPATGSPETLYTVQSGSTVVILGLTLANVHTSQVSASVTLVSTTTQTSQTQNTTAHIIKDTIPVGSSLEIMSGNKINLNEGDIKVDCSVADKVSVIMSYRDYLMACRNKVNGGLADGNAVVSGTLDVSNNVTLSADVTIGDDLILTDDLFFNTDATVINFGADNDVTLTHVHNTGLLLNSTNQFQFGDSGTYIHQSADGVLDLVSDTEIEINATTIDMNGTLILVMVLM